MGKPQNGHLPSVSNTDSAVYRGAEPRPRKIPSQSLSMGDPHEFICRDFVWGICSKGAQCRYRHELSFEAMKSILKFCHDYQNKSGCTRPGCTYLHVSNEEENLFLTTGQIPRILQDRYVAMSANNSSNKYINEITAQGPPPPPPPNGPAVGALPPSSLPAPLPTLLAPPPPPPPPTSSITAAQNTPPLFTAPPPAHTTIPVQAVDQPTPALALFDASKPPPPLPCITTVPTSTVKRPASDSCEAGQSKIRKTEVSKVENTTCEKCVHHTLRVHIFQKQAQKLETEKECNTNILQKKLKAFENGRLLLKSVVSPELFHILDDYIQSSASMVAPKMSDLMSPFNQISSLVTGSSPSLQRLFLRNAMELARKLVDVESHTSIFDNDNEVIGPSFLEIIRNVARKSEGVAVENRLSPVNKNSCPARANTYSNSSNVPLRPLSGAAATSGAGGAAKSGAHPLSHLYAQAAPLANTQKTQTIQCSMQPGASSQAATHQQNAYLANLQMQRTPQPQIATHPANILSPRGMIPSQGMLHSQGVVHPQATVRPQDIVPTHGVAQPQGMSPQHLHISQQQNLPQLQPMQQQHQNLQQQPIPQRHLQNGAHAQQGMDSQSGAHVQHGMHPQRGAHPMNETPAAVPPSAYVPYQASVPPLQWPYYPQYPPTSNKLMNVPQHVQTGPSHQSAPRPATTMAPLQNGYVNALPRYLQPPYNSAYQ